MLAVLAVLALLALFDLLALLAVLASCPNYYMRNISVDPLSIAHSSRCVLRYVILVVLAVLALFV